jgi:hypothetical protein
MDDREGLDGLNGCRGVIVSLAISVTIALVVLAVFKWVL